MTVLRNHIHFFKHFCCISKFLTRSHLKIKTSKHNLKVVNYEKKNTLKCYQLQDILEFEIGKVNSLSHAPVRGLTAGFGPVQVLTGS